MKTCFSVLAICSFFIAPQFVHSQEEPVRCGTDELHAQRMQDEEYQADFERKNRLVDAFIADRVENRMPVCPNEILIPVAVHFQGTGIPIACAIDMALDQVETLNLDFSGTNTDIGLWSAAQASTFPGIQNDESCIQFCLATLDHPAGFGLNDGDYAVTLDMTTGDNDPAWSGYLNFFVRDLGGGLLGYSPLGGSGNGDGIACTVSAFSSISCGGNTINGPYNLGRTMTHEVGHYFLLEHPWGGGGCASTDGVADTPVTSAATFGCPALGLVTCVDPVLWMSYMDYCDDLCLYMFSAGQVTRMEGYANTSLTNLMNNSTTTCQEAACFDYQVTSTFQDESCPGNDGRIDIAVIEGNPPYLYSINGGTTTQGLPTFLNLPSGDYDIVVTDASNCLYERSITIDQDNATIDILAVEAAFCGNDSGSVLVNVPLTGTFEYSIDGGLSWQSEPLFDNMNSGTYQVTVRNASGCRGFKNVTIGDENDLGIQLMELKNVNCPYAPNGAIKLALGGGESPFEFSIDEDLNIYPIADFQNLDVGAHTIYINDARDCSAQYKFNVFENFSAFDEDCPCAVYIPTAITADGDGVNDFLEVVASCPYANYSIQVFDRWGEVVFETEDPTRLWNGGIDEYYVRDGLYFYKVQLTWGAAIGSANVEEVVGSVLVIR
jgi:gliding motility-associated-like protein